MKKPEIVLIGAGNVGFHLGKALFSAGFEIKQVFSRSLEKASLLANITKSTPFNQFERVQNADLYILAVPDKAIATVASQLVELIPDQSLVVHCSGATPSKVLEPTTSRFGVFYPLQTFSLEKEPDFKSIPFCIDANSEKDRLLLESVAQQLSPKVYSITDEQRSILHVVAVIVNNFSNYLFQIGHQILEKENITFDLVRPLILETAQKVQNNNPRDMQTGPAIRGDQVTIERHLAFLEHYPEYREIYALISKKIP